MPSLPTRLLHVRRASLSVLPRPSISSSESITLSCTRTTSRRSYSYTSRTNYRRVHQATEVRCMQEIGYEEEKQRSKKRRAEAMARNRGLYSHYGRRQIVCGDERAENFGFFRGEAEELACQGVKPWDDDACVSLTDLLS